MIISKMKLLFQELNGYFTSKVKWNGYLKNEMLTSTMKCLFKNEMLTSTMKCLLQQWNAYFKIEMLTSTMKCLLQKWNA
jgi:hypothetical protein